jgi:hypothetical protein
MLTFTNSISKDLTDILDPFTEWFFAQNDQHLVLGPEEHQRQRAGGLTYETATDEK